MTSTFIYVFYCVSCIYSLVDFTNTRLKLTLELSGPAPVFAFDLHVRLSVPGHREPRRPRKGLHRRRELGRAFGS